MTAPVLLAFFNAVYLLALAAWVGSIAFFSFGVAPVLFRVLGAEAGGKFATAASGHITANFDSMPRATGDGPHTAADRTAAAQVATIGITHTAAAGTLITGTTAHDGTAPILRQITETLTGPGCSSPAGSAGMPRDPGTPHRTWH